MINERDYDNQVEKVNNARREGELVMAVIDCLKANNGAAPRKVFIPFVADVIGLTNEERDVTHVVENENGEITNRNKYHSALDWVFDDMKTGKYGEDCKIYQEEDDNVWIHEDIHALDSLKVKEVATYTGIKSKKDRRNERLQNISQYWMSLDKITQDLIKAKDGKPRDAILKIMEEKHCAAEDAYTIFLQN